MSSATLTNPKGLERLKQLLRVMEDVAKKPRAAYDINVYGEKFESPKLMAEMLRISEAKAPKCCTVACTAGWAGLDPWFRRRKFVTSVEIENDLDDVQELEVRIQGKTALSNCSDPDPVRVWFGITKDESTTLFFNGPAPRYDGSTAKDIVKYIKALIRKYEK